MTSHRLQYDVISMSCARWEAIPTPQPQRVYINYIIIYVIFTFASLGVVLKMYEDTKWNNVISNLKQFFG